MQTVRAARARRRQMALTYLGMADKWSGQR